MGRPPRVNYSFAPGRIERLKATPEFQSIANSTKKGRKRDEEIRYGKSVQRDILVLLADMDGRRIYRDREEFRQKLESLFRGFIKFQDYFWDVLMDALPEPDEAADIGTDSQGNPGPVPERGGHERENRSGRGSRLPLSDRSRHPAGASARRGDDVGNPLIGRQGRRPIIC